MNTSLYKTYAIVINLVYVVNYNLTTRPIEYKRPGV